MCECVCECVCVSVCECVCECVCVCVCVSNKLMLTIICITYMEIHVHSTLA